MRESKDIQAELDAAQADLETKVGQLKDIVEGKLETPKHVVEDARDIVSFVVANKWWFLAGVGALLLISRLDRDEH